MSDLLRSQTDLLILAVLQSGPEHGYAIIDQIKQRSEGSFALPEGTIYPVLHRLEREGLLSSTWSEVAGRRRRVYELTGAGRESLRVRQEDWRQFARAMQAVVGGAS
jgi:PadR family transcriptional regulator PadR